MSVSKGSINRVNRIKQSNQNTETSEKTQKYDSIEEKSTSANTKQINELQVEKFKLISRITQDIPDYLL